MRRNRASDTAPALKCKRSGDLTGVVRNDDVWSSWSLQLDDVGAGDLIVPIDYSLPTARYSVPM